MTSEVAFWRTLEALPFTAQQAVEPFLKFMVEALGPEDDDAAAA